MSFAVPRSISTSLLLALLAGCGGSVGEAEPPETSQSAKALKTEPATEKEQSFAITEVQGEAAPAAAAKTVRTYKEFWGTRHNTWLGNFRVGDRVAVQVAYDNGKASYFRGYAYVNCNYHHWENSGIPEYYSPVALSVSQAIIRVSGADHAFATGNSGADGLYAEWGPWVRNTDSGCYLYYAGLQSVNGGTKTFPTGFAGHHLGIYGGAILFGLCR